MYIYFLKDFFGADVASLICAMPNPATNCNDFLNNTIGFDNAFATVLGVSYTSIVLHK